MSTQLADPPDVAAAVLARRAARRESTRPLVGAARRVLSWAISLAVVLAAWQLFLIIFHVNSFIGRGPLDVWRYVTTGPDAAGARSRLLHNSGTTLRDAFIGLAAGTFTAFVFAVIFNLARTVERTCMPIAMVLRSVPLVAMTPLIALVFGRGLMCVTIVAGIVTFFPTLVNVTLALRATPMASIDLGRAYGASRFTMLRKVQIPSALPALFASLRVSAPLALVGAVLAEFLVTGAGLGYLIETSMASSVYNQLWAGVALITLYSTLLYTVISSVEKRVLGRFADLPT
jgi:ABC-type nitrate/sulfonate/bicarbonate transport system permease component